MSFSFHIFFIVINIHIKKKRIIKKKEKALIKISLGN